MSHVLGGTMHARTRITAAVVAAVGALTLTACDTGSTVVDKPKNGAAADVDTGTGEDTAKKEKAPEIAKVGDTLAWKAWTRAANSTSRSSRSPTPRSP